MSKKVDANISKCCEKCGGSMTIRERRSGDNAGKNYWVCSNYPDCKSYELFIDNPGSQAENEITAAASDASMSNNSENADSTNTHNNISEYIITCRACSSKISKNAKACPYCGEPNNIYNKKKMITIVSAVVFIILASSVAVYFAVFKNSNKNSTQKIIFTASSIEYRGYMSSDTCQTVCSTYSKSIDSYVADGYRIVSSTPKSVPTRFGENCVCVGTEYVVAK